MNGNGNPAYDCLQKAIQLNAAAVDAYELLAHYYVIMGNTEQAVETLELAEQLDPLSTIISQALSTMYVFARRFDDAMVQVDKLLEINPNMRICIEMKGWITGMKGDWAAALKYFEEVHRLTNHPLKGLMGLGFAYGKLGMKEKALEVIEKMELRQQQEPDAVLDADLAGVWWGLKNADKTFYHLNQCIDKRMGPVSYYLEYPPYDGIKKDPRYGEIKRRLNL